MAAKMHRLYMALEILPLSISIPVIFALFGATVVYYTRTVAFPVVSITLTALFSPFLDKILSAFDSLASDFARIEMFLSLRVELVGGFLASVAVHGVELHVANAIQDVQSILTETNCLGTLVHILVAWICIGNPYCQARD